MCMCEAEKKAVYGKIELKNGIVLNWLLFIEAKNPKPEEEAVFKGMFVRCWTGD